jgi:hypothetical protein
VKITTTLVLSVVFRPCDDVITDDQYDVLAETGYLNKVLDPPETRLPGGQNTTKIERVLHSRRVKLKTTLDSSENVNYTRNE